MSYVNSANKTVRNPYFYNTGWFELPEEVRFMLPFQGNIFRVLISLLSSAHIPPRLILLLYQKSS